MAGGGDHGHLEIVMTHMEYSVISATPCVEPFNPGPPPPLIAAGTSAVDAVQIGDLRDEFRRIHTNRINVDQALNRIILEAYDNMYTSQLEYLWF
jgi:hypothetical protein